MVEELLRGLNGRGIAFEASHYRTAAGGEVDLILEGDFGLIPIEIKYAQTVRIVVDNDERPRFYTERILGVPFAFI